MPTLPRPPAKREPATCTPAGGRNFSKPEHSMGRINKRAQHLVDVLQQWNAIDQVLEAAAGEFLRDLLQPNAPRGSGTHQALELLKHHVGFDRYRMPAAVLDALAIEEPAAVVKAVSKRGP